MYHSFGRVMQKLYTKNIVREQLFFAGVIAALFFVGALLFHPTLHFFQGIERQQETMKFLSKMQQTDFTMREYWQYREFYSPGSFSFDPQAVSLAGALQFNDIPSVKTTLLTFTSPNLVSTDSIVEKSSKDYITEAYVPNTQTKTLVVQPDRVAYSTPDGKIHLIFLRSSDEMVKTLGLFDYGKKEKDILEHKLWLNETTITP
jgi:hypothetical protein